MIQNNSTSRIVAFTDDDRDEFILELQRLLSCYQIASADDRKIVWAVLNKYAPFIENI